MKLLEEVWDFGEVKFFYRVSESLDYRLVLWKELGYLKGNLKG